MNPSIFIAAADASGGLPFWIIGLWILILASFTGFEIITKVPPTLHTPLMSGANAISGITLVGALYCVFAEHVLFAQILGFCAVALATINVVGGFMVTDRMLAMFSTKKKGGK
jgi:NAD(P) transhydrogenase subunit alpha